MQYRTVLVALFVIGTIGVSASSFSTDEQQQASINSYCGVTDQGSGNPITGKLTMDYDNSVFYFFSGCWLNGTFTTNTTASPEDKEDDSKENVLYIFTLTLSTCSRMSIASAMLYPAADFPSQTLQINGVSNHVPWYIVAAEDECAIEIPSSVYCANLPYGYTVTAYTQAPRMISLSFVMESPCYMSGNYWVSSSTNITSIAWASSTCNASVLLVNNIMYTAGASAPLTLYLMIGDTYNTIDLSTSRCSA